MALRGLQTTFFGVTQQSINSRCLPTIASGSSQLLQTIAVHTWRRTFAVGAVNKAGSQKQKVDKKSGPIRNRDIPHRMVKLVDPQTGRLGPLTELKVILDNLKSSPPVIKDAGTEEVPQKKSKLDKYRWAVELVREDPEPIVKIVDQSVAYKKQKAQREKQMGQMEEKEIQMTWGVSSGDLKHKLGKVHQELEKGNRVNLVYTPKKGQPLPSPQDMETRIQETLDLLTAAGSEWKERDVQRYTTILYFQGQKQK